MNWEEIGYWLAMMPEDHSSMNQLATLFLTPVSILVGALGVAKTEGLKLGISLLGIVTTAFWIWAYFFEGVVDLWSPIAWLPVLFGLGWAVSTYVHGKSLSKERKGTKKLRLEPDVASQFTLAEMNNILRVHAAIQQAGNTFRNGLAVTTTTTTTTSRAT